MSWPLTILDSPRLENHTPTTAFTCSCQMFLIRHPCNKVLCSRSSSCFLAFFFLASCLHPQLSLQLLLQVLHPVCHVRNLMLWTAVYLPSSSPTHTLRRVLRPLPRARCQPGGCATGQVSLACWYPSPPHLPPLCKTITGRRLAQLERLSFSTRLLWCFALLGPLQWQILFYALFFVPRGNRTIVEEQQEAASFDCWQFGS